MIAFCLGGLGWTLAEYLIHRFDGHGNKGRTASSREHLAHHANPMYFAATWKKLAAASAVGVTLWGLTGGLFAAGFVVMYLTYERVHRRIHTHGPIGPYGRWVRHHHLLHHHSNPRLNHGVTSPIWDVVFRTYQRKDIVNVPFRRAPVWLRDPETGLVAEAFSGRYSIRGNPRASPR
ncbi:MAG: sterol desaturase/sphingolipid hydroxylase (fatty acid hydroxylase superfamily), partial [Myxococcota bacterium]